MREIQQIDKRLWIELQREVYKRSYYEFFKAAYKVLLPGEVYKDNWHIKVLCDVLQNEAVRIAKKKPKTKDLNINMPFRSSKSLITTIIYPAWVWGFVSQSIKFICTSYAQDLAYEHATDSRDLIRSDWYKELCPNVMLKQDQDNKGLYKLSYGGGYRKSVGLGGQITGSGGDVIIADDIQNPKKAASEVERNKANKFWKETVASRLNQPDIGLRIHIQQRLHEDDVTGSIMAEQPELYNFISIPAKIETIKEKKIEPKPKSLAKYYQDGLFWKSRFSQKVLDGFKISLGTMGYIGQLQQEPAPLEGNLLKREWFDIVEPGSITRDYTQEPILFYLDTAETEKTQNDYTAILACFKKDNCLYITNVQRVKKEFFQLCKWIPMFCHQQMYTKDSMVKVEPKSSGKSVVSQLRSTSNLNIGELDPPKDDKLTRGAAQQPIFESKRIKLVKGSYIPVFLDEVCTFPNSANDDMYDVLIHAVEDNLSPDNFLFTFL